MLFRVIHDKTQDCRFTQLLVLNIGYVLVILGCCSLQYMNYHFRWHFTMQAQGKNTHTKKGHSRVWASIQKDMHIFWTLF